MHSQAIALEFWKLFEERISKIPSASLTIVWIFVENQVGFFIVCLTGGGEKENRKIWNTNVLQFPTIHHVPSIHNLGFYFLFIFFLEEVKMWKKNQFVSIYEIHILHSSSANPGSIVQYTSLAGERWAFFIRQQDSIKWFNFQNLPYLTLCSIWVVWSLETMQ